MVLAGAACRGQTSQVGDDAAVGRDGTASGRPARRQANRPPAQRLAAARCTRNNNGMNILLNGEPRALAAPIKLVELLREEGLGERRVAVEINGEIVPRGRHADTALNDGDKVEIVHALGGG